MLWRPVSTGSPNTGSPSRHRKPRLTLRAASLAAAAVVASGSLLTVAPAPVRAATYSVTTTADTGAGSLRDAITSANANAGADVIDFNIPGTAPWVITPAAPLPEITDRLTIDATTQASGGAPGIWLDGSGITDTGGLNENGLTVSAHGADNSVLKALGIVHFPDSGVLLTNVSGVTIQASYIGTDGASDLGNGQYGITLLQSDGDTIHGNLISGNGAGGCCGSGHGIWVSDALSSGTVITGNLIGTDAAGTTAIGNSGYGISISSPDNTVGGTTAPDRNVVSGNGRGITITGTTAQGNAIRGNYIGTNSTGTAAVGSQVRGIELNGTDDAFTIGGTGVGAGNLISGNGFGILLGNNASNAVIRGNSIGVAANGTSPLPNTSDGIAVTLASANVQIGGTAAGAGNTIARNTGSGVSVSGTSTGISILGNSIHDNGGLGIDLGNTGVTPNDPGDGDTGANNLQNFPVITSAAGSNIGGSLDTAGGAYRVEVFSNATCDPSGNGEGATLLGVATGVTSGTWAIDAFPINGTFLTATTTNEATGDTSEFGPCLLVTDGLPAAGHWAVNTAAATTGTGTSVAAGNGGTAQFTFDYFTPSGIASGSWSFYTTAASTGTITIPWKYSGFYAYFQVRAGLESFQVGNGPDTTTTLIDEGPANCSPCAAPSGGFSYSGTATFNVQAGDVYGFTITGSNFDSNGTMTGELLLGNAIATSCADAQTLYGATTDGRDVIHPVNGQQFQVYCKDMAGSAKDYVAVPAPRQASGDDPGSAGNTGQYATGGAADGTTVTTTFSKLRIDPANLAVDIGDLTFATSTGLLTHPDDGGSMTVTSMPYATAMSCDGAASGAANIDLRGTPFAVNDTWTLGWGDVGTATKSQGDQVVAITGGGGCGWNSPNPAAYNPFNPTAPDYSLQLRYLTTPVITLATPVVFAAVTTGVGTADLYGRVDGAANESLELEVSKSASCANGALSSPIVVAGSVHVTTDASGYFKVSNLSGVASGQFVSLSVTSPSPTGSSLCVRASADNDYWPKALPLSDSATVTTQDVIDVQGKSRWYRFPILPDQRITVTLSGLPADYDLAVFKDIGTEFVSQLVPSSTADLTKLSAEFAPQVFSPQVFSPQVFSPQVFSPDAYSPQVFSPQVFSPQVFSPQVFSPQVFSPQVFSPQVFSPQVFSSEELAQAFSSAQTRSIIAVSAQTGPSDEGTVVNSWNNTGWFYVRVSGRSGAFDPSGTFTISVTKSASTCAGVTDTTLIPRADAATGANGGYKTVILTDSSVLPLGALNDPTSLAAKLAAFRTRQEVNGVLVDVAGDTRVGQLKHQAADNSGCPFATNLVAGEIKGIVDSYRANNPGLRYVTIVGGDTVVPFFRYPDQSLLGEESGYFPPVKSDSISEASLRQDFVLSQDAYGSGVSVSLQTNDFPVPGLAVGRLVETQTEIAGLIDAYTAANGLVHPQSSLVTGYDFLADAAGAVSAELAAGTGHAVDELIAPNNISPQDPQAWTATDLRTRLFNGTGHDVVFLAGHFSANSALAADFSTSIITTELAASTTSFTNDIIFSAGCHSGYNLLDAEALPGASLPLDWAQAFAQKQAILIAGTGYQYGDTDFLEYSERLYRNLAQELHAGFVGTPVSIGEALRNAKLSYLSTTPDIRGIHEKALLEATLFGLPMWGVDMQGVRTGSSNQANGITPTPVATGPAAQLGLATAPLDITPGLGTRQTLNLKTAPYDGSVADTIASWYEGAGHAVTTNPAEPTLPLVTSNVSSNTSGYVLRGVGFRGGSYQDTPNITPLTGAPTTELRGVHAPFVSPVFFPMKLWTPNYYGALGGSGGTTLLSTPVQYKSDPANPNKAIERTYTDLDVELYYSSNLTTAALSDAPTIVSVDASDDGQGLLFTAQVVGDPKAAVHQVWVTYTTGSGSGGTGTWQSLDLRQCVSSSSTPLPTECGATEDSRIWRGRLANLPNLRYVAQAANGLGMVAFSDNFGQYYATAAVAPAQTALTLVNPPTSGTFGDSRTVTVRLADGSTPISGRTVFVTIGGATVSGTTGSNGQVAVSVPLNSQPAVTKVSASFQGDDTYLASSADGVPFTINKAPSALVLAPATSTSDYLAPASIVATLTGGTSTPLLQRTIGFLITSPTGTTTLSTRITDYLGKATLTLPTGTVGAFGISASFGSKVNVPGGGFLDLTDTSYDAITATANVTKTAGTTTVLTFTRSPQPYTYDGTAFGATATVTGPGQPGLSQPVTVTYSGTTAGGSSYGPTTTAPVAAGSYSAAASFAGANGYQSSTSGPNAYTINKAPSLVAVTLGGPSTVTYDGQPHGPTAVVTGAGGLNQSLTVAYAGTGTTTYASSTAPSAAGTYIASAAYAGDGNHNGSSASQAFTIAKASSTTVVSCPASVTYNGSAQTPCAVSVTGAGGLSLTPTPTYANNIYAGAATASYTFAGDGNHGGSTGSKTFTIAKATRTISISNLPATPFLTGSFTPVFAYPGSGTASTTSSTTSVCTVSGTGLVTFIATGTCTLTAAVTADANYKAAAGSPQSVTVGKRPATLAYTGALSWSSGAGTTASVTLSGTVTPAAGGTVSTANATVDFLLFHSGNFTGTPDNHCLATANAAGAVSCVKTLGLDNWTVIMTIPAGNAYFTAAPAAPAVVAVIQTANKSVTGAGTVVDPSPSNLPVKVAAAPANRAAFGFAVNYKTGTTTPQGMAVYTFRATDGYDYWFTTSSWTGGSLTISSGKGAFTGGCKVTAFNPATMHAVSGIGGTGYTCKWDVTDGSPDKLALTVTTSAGVLYHQVGTTAAQVTLATGGLTVKS